MPHYVSLIRYTNQGMSKIKESPSRLDAARKAAEAVGGKDSRMVPDHGAPRRRFDFRVS